MRNFNTVLLANFRDAFFRAISWPFFRAPSLFQFGFFAHSMSAGVLDISMAHLLAAFLGPFHLLSFIVARGIWYSLAVMPLMANSPTTTTHFKLVDSARYSSFSHKNAIGCKSNFLISRNLPTKKILLLYLFPLSPLPLPLSLLPPPMRPISRNFS